MDITLDPGILISLLVSAVVVLVVYYFFLVRALVEMIRLNAPGF